MQIDLIYKRLFIKLSYHIIIDSIPTLFVRHKFPHNNNNFLS